MVGAGTAGCTLAARLTENPAVHVLLMEAGPPGKRRRTGTISAFPGLLGSELDWNNATEPQEFLNGRRLAWPRGRVLGGSAVLGAGIHLRACRADLDAWNLPSWSFDALAPLWSDPPEDRQPPAPNVLTEAFLRACGERGISGYETFAGPAEEGAGLFPVARVNGERWGPARAFLKPALKRGNLTVWTGVEACRILLENGRAAGIEYLLKGSRQQIRAEREVILCAGTIGSPQLLMLSGVGPPDRLEPLGIPVSVPLAATGENLQDHVAVALRWTSTQPVSLAGAATRGNRWRFRWRKEGPLASNLIEAGAFLKSTKGLDACDLELLFTPLFRLEHGLTAGTDPHGFTLMGALLTPASRGRLRLASADSTAPPRIDPRYLAEPEDRARLEKAAARVREIAAARAFSPYRGESGGKQEVVEELAIGLHHAVGTCRMGLSSDDSVVDTALRVHGIAGLRVADASVMPVIPRAHPNATVTVIAEEAARLIGQA